MHKKLRWIGIILVVVLAAGAVAWFSLSQGKICEDKECYDSILAKCEKGVYVNEEPEASWGYHIKGQLGNDCRIEVTLLQAKKGDSSLRNYEGSKMICSYPVGQVVFPEEDLTMCHGRLKEDLQTILIENLHAYIIDNLDDIKAGLLNGY